MSSATSAQVQSQTAAQAPPPQSQAQSATPIQSSTAASAIDRYIVIHVATTCDEHGVYVTKDSAEVIELGWIALDAKTLEELHRESVLVKPMNTPITPLCTSLTTLTWEHVRNASSFRDAITRLDSFVQEKISQNQEFAFVTLDAWDLRVQLPREARDKSVVLPAYLQHSRTFDLRTEYSNWQQYHPESLPYSPSSLTNICTALEVEPVQSSAPIKHNLPFHLQALAPASPRRALEEAVTLARVLRSLVRKSQPAEEHPAVLSHPMDARADVRSFLSERSKVLHLNGLPHDTTQSELESWFTQYGGRPIAFWTLRTPDQHKPTGTGFAVFSSHEEAAESLCMNGRALNERAIEVSPSSNRVLERASEVLTPFPPSKNRPRPGDWTCPSCGFSNFQRRTACFRCSYPAVGHPTTDPMAAAAYAYGYPNAGMPPFSQHDPNMPPRARNLGGSAPFRPGDWRCGQLECLYHNFAKNITCLRCGSSRAHALPVAEGGFPYNMHGGHPPPPASEYAQASGPTGPMTPGPGFAAAPAFTPGPGAYGQPAMYGMPPGYPPMGYPPNGAPPTQFNPQAPEQNYHAANNSSITGANVGHQGHHSATNGSAQADQFAFLNSGFDNLHMEERGRTGASGHNN